MTENEKDERDLKILAEHEANPLMDVVILARRHNVTARHVRQLIKEALEDDN